MRRALVLLPVVLVTACAAGTNRAYTPRDAPPATGSASAAAAVKAPETETIEVGSKLTVRVEWPAAPDPMLRTFTDYYVRSWKAVVAADDAYLETVEGPAAREAYAWVRGFRGRTVTGVATIYALNVSAVMGEGAQLNACVDETGLRLISRRTGEPEARQPTWTRAAYLQAVVTHRGDDGLWRVKDFRHSDEGCDR
ncbi:hypothetical protein OIE66_34865 [Nonomuraea sp. NBC_01738]|uniref:hypothetical protein n=1 Tax=Nonomuraea sp. NBC_01738 TaxID=2976003 RepID=UPI002E15768B|nr:hypothetical protein OIE66_34865 [Nonomuraea sp. NBC_01738]